MTTYTVSTSSNFAALASKAGTDTYNLSAGAVLTMDSDTRYGPNCTATTGPFGSVVVAASGGTIKIDGTKVRLIPYTGGSGNVPAAGTAVSQGSVSAELLGVWSAINTTPTAAGSAMPSTGFIKVRNIAGGAFASGALTGIGATSRGADIVGWIEVIGVVAKTFQLAVLGVLSAQGAWLSPFDTTGAEIQTSGSAGQSIQLPASVTGTYYAGVYVETSAGSGTYKRWPNAADIVNANIATADERGRMCWISAAGVLVFGSDGTNTVGMVPPSGCRIRVPNVLLGAAQSASLAANNTPSSTAASRFANETVNTAGTIFMDTVSCAWLIQNTSAGFLAFSVTNSLALSPLSVQNPQGFITFSGNICAQVNSAAGDGYIGTTVMAVNGAEVDDNTFFMQTNNTASQSATVFSGYNISFNRNRFHCGLVPTTGGNGATSNTINGGSADSNEFIYHTVGFANYSNFAMTNTKFCGWPFGTVQTTPAASVFTTIGGTDFLIDGFNWLLSAANTCHTAGNSTCSFGAIQAASQNVRVRNVGTAAAPLSLGTVNPSTRVAFSSAFQVSLKSVKYQQVFMKDGASIAQQSGYRANVECDLENCIIPGTAITLQSQNSFVRGVRAPVSPVASTAAVGIHWVDWFSSDTVGQIWIAMCPPTTNTAAQCAATGGAPKWPGGPGLQLNAVGDQMTWTMPYFAQGYTGITGLTQTGGTAAKYLIEFAVDLHDGNGMSAYATATTGALSALSISPTAGVMLRVRVTCATANTETISRVQFACTSTLAAQQAVAYPLDPVTISVTGLAAGSRVKVTRTDTSSVIANALAVAGVFSISGDYIGVPMAIEARCASSSPFYQPWTAVGTPTSAGLALTALQVRDDQ